MEHRITGDRQQVRFFSVGYSTIHLGVDDATRLACLEVLADEQKPTLIGFLSRSVAWFNGQADRFIQALCKEWSYAMAFPNSEERNRWLPLDLPIDSRLRKLSARGRRSPQQLDELLR